MRFDREDYSNARNLASFEYLGKQFRVVRRRYDGRPWCKRLMVLHGNAPVAEQGYAWKDTTDPAECVEQTLETMRRSLPNAKALANGLALIHGSPVHGGRQNTNVTEGI